MIYQIISINHIKSIEILTWVIKKLHRFVELGTPNRKAR